MWNLPKLIERQSTMKVKTIDGHEVEIDMDEAKHVHDVMAGNRSGSAPEHFRNLHTSPGANTYAAKTHEVMLDAQNELREATGDYPENLKELYEFAVKYKLFGDREDTHIMCNFLKVFYCLIQKETHTA